VAVASHGENGRDPEPGIREILAELRDLRIEMRDDRQRADEERRTADAAGREERRAADAAWQEERRAVEAAWREERRAADAAWQEERRTAEAAWKAERRAADERFEGLIREFREDSLRRDAATQKAFRDIRTVGLSIVKTLNLHTRILERIDAKLGARDDGRPGPNGGGTSSRR
jgi:hypothetical protein